MESGLYNLGSSLLEKKLQQYKCKIKYEDEYL